MKAILKFDLNDHDDKLEHLRCVKSLDMALVLWHIKERLFFDEDIDTVDEFKKWINQLMDEHDIDINTLIE